MAPTEYLNRFKQGWGSVPPRLPTHLHCCVFEDRARFVPRPGVKSKAGSSRCREQLHVSSYAKEIAMNAVFCGLGAKCLGNVFRGVLFAILVLLPVTLFGQSYFGTVSGEVTDASGAIVQGAKVVLVDQARGFTFTTTSDSSGRYLFASIPPGAYTVSAEMPGFEKEVHTNVKVNVTENVTANLKLRVASATQSIQVEAQAQTLA